MLSVTFKERKRRGYSVEVSPPQPEWSLNGRGLHVVTDETHLEGKTFQLRPPSVSNGRTGKLLTHEVIGVKNKGKPAYLNVYLENKSFSVKRSNNDGYVMRALRWLGLK